jgi:WS/DGAT/MGAT family acyltransferase
MATHMDRLSSVDASFLAQEREGSHMHIGGLLIFEGPAPSREDFVAHLEARLHLVPRYRQKVSFPRLEMGRPLWVDDPTFNMGYHVRHTALPAPGSVEQLRLLASRIFSQRLDRSKPLWELWLVEGYERDKFVIINKTHHSLVDGVSGSDLTTVLFDLQREGTEVPAPEHAWSPSPEPSDAGVVVKGMGDLATTPFGLARSALGAAASPGRTLERAREVASGLGEVAWGRISPAPQTPLNGPIGPHRRMTWARVPVADLRGIKKELGGTVNDVFLAVIAGALHHWLRSRGVRTEGLEIRSAVPVSVRARGDEASLGNQIAIMIGRLPTFADDPLERLRLVRESMKDLKASKQALGAEVIASLEDFAPPTIFAQASRLHFSTRMYNLLTTNVPGPQFPLYLLGREMLELVPIAFLAPEQRLAVASMSYNGSVTISLIGDYDGMADLEAFADLVIDEVAALRGAAGLDRMAATK